MPPPVRKPLELPQIAWWEKAKDDEGSSEAARAMYSQGQALEMASYGRRYRHALLYRLVSGEDAPAIFGYWMSSRVAPAIGSLSLANYVEPAINVAASALEVFENRIGTLRPFVEILPNGADFETRDACGKGERWIDQHFEDAKLYNTTRLAFRDGGTWGTSPVKVAPSLDGKRTEISRCLGDEILVDDAASFMGNPSSLIQRRYVTRPDLYVFADMAPSADRDALVRAIRAAPNAYASTFWGGSSPIEMVALLEGWKLPGADGKPGRRILSLPHYVLEDDDWTRDHFPFAFFRWQPQSVGFWGASAAMALLPYQVTINKHVERQEANFDRVAFARWLVDGNTKIRAEALGGRPGAITRYTGGRPEVVTPPSNAPDAYDVLQRWIDRAYMRVGLNQQAASGLKQPGITSGTALRTMVQIEDARNKSLQVGLEDLVRDIAILVMECAQEIDQTVIVPGVDGGPMKWSELGLKVGNHQITAFPTSSLPNEPAGRQQQIQEDYANGLIDKRAYFRLKGMPDQRAYALLATAADDLIESNLDKMVKTGKYVPAEPYDDLPEALRTTQARYWLEKRLGKTPRATLRLLQAHMAQISEMITMGQQFLPSGQTPGIAPPVAGPQTPGAAPAAPPLQVTPSVAPPVPLAA